MTYRNNFLLFCIYIIAIVYPQINYAHEPWLLTAKQIELLNSQSRPEIFSNFTVFNVSVFVLTVSLFLVWVFLNYLFPEKKNSINHKINLSLLLMRCGIGSTLIFLSLGLIPRVGITFFSEPTLFGPEFLINSLSNEYQWISYLELLMGICFLFGVLVRFISILTIFLYIFAIIVFGLNTLQYIGFYLGIILFIILLGSGKYAVFKDKPLLSSTKHALLILQICTGLNFVFSSISIKFLQPNLDIGMLQIHQAFTFGIPYEHFAFLMMIVEAFLGLCIILGYRLQYIATILILLFIFLSIDLSENFFAHNFIYGILLTFILLGGIPFLNKNYKYFSVRR